jgi:hypothetical protein
MEFELPSRSSECLADTRSALLEGTADTWALFTLTPPHSTPHLRHKDYILGYTTSSADIDRQHGISIGRLRRLAARQHAEPRLDNQHPRRRCERHAATGQGATNNTGADNPWTKESLRYGMLISQSISS